MTIEMLKKLWECIKDNAPDLIPELENAYGGPFEELNELEHAVWEEEIDGILVVSPLSKESPKFFWEHDQWRYSST